MWLGTGSAKKALGIAVVCVAAVSACSESTGGQRGATGSPATTAETTGMPDTDGEETEATPHVDTGESGYLEMVDPQSKLRTSSSGGVLDVETSDSDMVLTFEMGSQKCYGVTTSVVETDDEVVVDLQTGLRLDVAEPCVEGVYPYRVVVELDAPLGDRPIRMAELTEPVEDTAAVEQDTGNEPSVEHLIGMPIEEGVQWALNHDVEWHLESYDGVARDVQADKDGYRLGFVAESDRIVKAEWK